MNPRLLIAGMLISLWFGLVSAQTSVPAPNGATPETSEAVPAMPAQKQKMNSCQTAMSQACDNDPDTCAKIRAKFQRRMQENA